MSSITLELRPDMERKLREQAARTGQTLEALLLRAVEQVAAADPAPASTADQLTPEQRSAEWRAWVASHKPLPYMADDSRESIYEGRGE